MPKTINKFKLVNVRPETAALLDDLHLDLIKVFHLKEKNPISKVDIIHKALKAYGGKIHRQYKKEYIELGLISEPGLCSKKQKK